MIKKWPLHPKPKKHQLLYSWVEDLAKAYGVSYRNFCNTALGLTVEEVRNLRSFRTRKSFSYFI
jgi:hypothetical protein